MIVDSSAVLGRSVPRGGRGALREGDRRIPELPHVHRQHAGGLHRFGRPRRCDGRSRTRRILESAAIELAPVTVEHAEAARRAWGRFGKGNHPAALNFGDCFAYALAVSRASLCCSRARISPKPISRRHERQGGIA